MRLPGDAMGFRQVVIAGTALLAIAICAATEIWGISKLDQVIVTYRSGNTTLTSAAQDMRDEVLQLRRYEKDVLLNVGSPERVQSYQAKWQDAFSQLRYDLVRARRSKPGEADSSLQAVVDSLELYRTGFLRTYDQIQSGTVSTSQQANAQANQFRDAAHNAEGALDEIIVNALARAPDVGPALFAQRCGLAVSLALLTALVGRFVSDILRMCPLKRSATEP